MKNVPCIACNFSSVLERFPGRCDHCRGSGTKYGMTSRVRGFWPFARLSAITETCPNCGGTGICPDCKETTGMPGWCRVFSLDGLGLTAGRKIPTDPVSVEE